VLSVKKKKSRGTGKGKLPLKGEKNYIASTQGQKETLSLKNTDAERAGSGTCDRGEKKECCTGRGVSGPFGWRVERKTLRFISPKKWAFRSYND